MKHSLNRRTFLALGGAGVLGLASSLGLASAGPLAPSEQRGKIPPGLNPPPGVKHMALVGTDGWASMPKGSRPKAPWYPDVMAEPDTDTYIFGFRNVTALNRAQVEAQRGHTQISAPFISVEAGKELWVTLSNLGLVIRPDLVDSHTLHWHGFRNAIPFYDGVPETSISVPIGRDFTYVFRPETDSAGTYMYHCHFEDVEHVTMGMSGIALIRPQGQPFRAYDAADTAFNREYAILVTELDSRGHFNDAHIQATDWTDFQPNFWLMNGRAYPDTLAPNGSADANGTPLPPPGAENTHLAHQPNSSLIICNAGENVLVRLVNLGFQEQSFTLPGIPLRIVGSDARYLTPDKQVVVDTVDIGPGESRDLIFTAPATPGTYPFYNRDVAKYPGTDADQWSGGQRTHVVVKPAGVVPAQGVDADGAPLTNHWEPSWLTL